MTCILDTTGSAFRSNQLNGWDHGIIISSQRKKEGGEEENGNRASEAAGGICLVGRSEHQGVREGRGPAFPGPILSGFRSCWGEGGWRHARRARQEGRGEGRRTDHRHGRAPAVAPAPPSRRP